MKEHDNAERAFIALTIDVDPDANRAGGTGQDCVSPPFRGRVTVDAARQGLIALNKLLLSLKLPATVFWEARTLNILSHTDPGMISGMADNKNLEHACHGLRHEDYTGKRSESPPPEEKIQSCIEKATRVISDRLGTTPIGFRAPYCRVDARTLRMISASGYLYDASKTLDPRSVSNHPAAGHRASAHLYEIPLLRWHDRAGRPISGYLWQLLEGRRGPEEYKEMAAEIGERYPGRLLQLAVHPWHLVVDENGHPFPDRDQSTDRILELLNLLRGVPHVKFTTLRHYLEHRLARISLNP